MNSKRKGLWKRGLIFLAAQLCALQLCFVIYNLADQKLNGVIRSWVENNFIVEFASYDPETDTSYEGRDIKWHSVKELFIIVLCGSMAAGVTIVFVTAWVYADRKVKQEVTNTNRMIRTYMMGQADVETLFLEENPELYALLVEIRTSMERNEQLMKEEADRKNDLIVYLAHDLKTPLTSVIGYLSLLAEVPDMPVEQKAKYTNIALDKAQRLEKLINEFFDITRYNLQQISLEKERLDLSYMLVQMTDEFYPILNAHGNRVLLQVEEGLEIYGDGEKLARVFNNILKNAIAYSYPDTEIQILVTNNEQGVNICFRNQGRTIPGYKLDAIFEKFFRLDEARSTNTGGAGLGLAIAKEIVTLHGGRITADSENEVTTFQISLPNG